MGAHDVNNDTPAPSIQAEAESPFSFAVPTEFVELPSGGEYYPPNHPLHGEKHIEVRHMTAKEEDILTSQTFIKKGYSICVFPESEYLDETILLNPFKRGAFKIAIEHELSILPIVFLDCKRKFPWYTTHGYPGQLRVKALDIINTKKMKKDYIQTLAFKMHHKIHKELLLDPKQNAVNAIMIWEKKTS